MGIKRIGLACCVFVVGLASAENATVPGDVTTPYPTVIHLAVEWKIQGDDNLNAACALRFRETGVETWHEGLPRRRGKADRHPLGNGRRRCLQQHLYATTKIHLPRRTQS